MCAKHNVWEHDQETGNVTRKRGLRKTRDITVYDDRKYICPIIGTVLQAPVLFKTDYEKLLVVELIIRPRMVWRHDNIVIFVRLKLMDAQMHLINN